MNVRPKTMIDEMVALLLSKYNIDVTQKTRIQDVVISRAALFNVCRGYYSATTLGKYFGKNHATVLHHFKNHQALMLISQYREIFSALSEVVLKHDQRAHLNTINQLDELQSLRIENQMLKIKLKEYETIDS